jgi:hypothetical protein
MYNIENDAFNNSSAVACVLVAKVMFSPRRCSARTVGYTYKHID